MQLYFYLIYFYFFYLFWKKLAAITASRAVQPAICSLERHFLSLQLSLTPLPHTLSLFPRAILLITAHNYSSHTHIYFLKINERPTMQRVYPVYPLPTANFQRLIALCAVPEYPCDAFAEYIAIISKHFDSFINGSFEQINSERTN